MSGGKSRLSVVLVVAVLAGFVCVAGAEGADSSVEKLVNLVPDDVVGFVATSGGDELKPAFEKTILGRMWNDPGVQSFCQEVKKEFLRKVKEEEGDDEANAINMGVELADLFLKRPIIIGAARKKAKEGLPVYGFAIVDAGLRKAEIVSAVAKLEKLAFEGLDEDDRIEIKIGDIKMRGLKDAGEVPAYWGWVGKRFVFAINDGEGLAIQHLKGNSLRIPPPYLAGVKGTGDAFALYVDTEKVFEAVGAMARMEGEEDDFKVVRTVLSELGLRNVRTMVARIGFSGSDVVSNELVRLQGPRTGLLACLGTIDLSMFDMVDATVLSAGVLNCDVGGVYDTVMRAIRVGSPKDAYPEIQGGIAEFEKETGVKIRRGLLASLGGPMAFYSLPAGVMMDAPSGGIVAIAELKDAGLWGKTMASLAKVATAESDGVVQVSTQVQEGRTFHCWVIAPLAMMQIMPTWTIADNHVVIGSNTGLCNRAVKQIMSGKSGGESLRRTEGFRKATAGVPKNLMSFTYSNSQLQFNQMLMSVQQFWPMITMIAQQGDIRLPFMLPQLGHIGKDMGPCYQYALFDGEGLRCHYQGPGVEPSVGAVAGASIVGVATLVPALTNARDEARQAVSSANLHQMGIVLKMYSDDHKGKMPKRLEETVPVYCSADSKLFESPRKPKDFDGPSYIYIQHETENIRGAHYYIVVYENPEFCDDKIPALFLDYSVRAMGRGEFLEALEKTYKFLGREMPETRFKGGRKGGEVRELR
ncbi:MAG: hypothetical protein ACYSTF_05215 [Planctomycetota bacterium]